MYVYYASEKCNQLRVCPRHGCWTVPGQRTEAGKVIKLKLTDDGPQKLYNCKRSNWNRSFGNRLGYIKRNLLLG